MSLKSAPYYWVECDYPGCGMRLDYGDFSAMADEGQARDYYGDDWFLDPDGKDYCYAHSVWDDEKDERVPAPETRRLSEPEPDMLL